MKAKTTKKAASKKTAAPKKKVTPKKTTIPKKKVASKKTAAPKKGKKAAKKVVNRAKKVERNKKIVTTTTVTTTTTTTTSITPKETHYLLILDESGSMSSVKRDTLNGLNEQINTIKSLDEKYPDQDYFISIIKFDDEITPLFENIPASQVRNLTDEDYKPDGMTRLYDAIGSSVNNLNKRIKDKVASGEASALVVILTDGAENHSTEYKHSDPRDRAKIIRELLAGFESNGMWTFTFMGANQDAVLTAQQFGINVRNAVTYTSSNVGTDLAFKSINSALRKRAAFTDAGLYGATTDNFLSTVTNCSATLGEDASTLDLSGTISEADIQQAKDDLNAKNKPSA